MNNTKQVNQPRVITVIFIIVGILLFLILKPILFSKQQPAPKVPGLKNIPILEGMPESYAEVEIEKPKEREKIPKSLPVIIPPKLPIIGDTEGKRNLVTIEKVIVKPVKKEPTERGKDIAKGIASSPSFPGFKPVRQKPRMDNIRSLKVALQKPGSKYLIQAGNTISAITITGINSDLPGHVVARIDRNIYDSIDGTFLLVPQGSKLLGSYSSSVKLNQKRVQISWKEIKMPDGSTVNLGKGQPGIGNHGMAGVSGNIENYYLSNMISIFSVALLNSSAKQISNVSDGSLNDEVSGEMANDIADAGSDIFRKQIQLGPTIRIPIGESIRVLLTQDLVFEEPYNAKTF